MNIVFRSTIVVVASVVFALSATAQDRPQVINVPITNPDEAVTLEINLQSAFIEVIGERREDAQFEVTASGAGRKIVTPSGVTPVSGGAYQLEIEERDNVLSFDAGWRASRMTVRVRLPRRANLELRTINNGELVVKGVEGNLKLTNVNGPITATGISGSVIAESVNEDITVQFDRIDDSGVTSFETINGDLRLGLPESASVKLHLDTARGEIYSDFDVEVEPSKPVVKRRDDARGAEIRIESVIVANINGGGGPIVRMKGLQGDIYIEKR